MVVAIYFETVVADVVASTFLGFSFTSLASYLIFSKPLMMSAMVVLSASYSMVTVFVSRLVLMLLTPFSKRMFS